jgi:hypothetical protein
MPPLIFGMSDSKENSAAGPRVFTVVTPSAEDLERARSMPLSACPRRYCWWWHSLAFDWSLAPSEGCQFSEFASAIGWKSSEIPCCRADESSTADHFEPREPHLAQDGFDDSRFNDPGSSA